MLLGRSDIPRVCPNQPSSTYFYTDIHGVCHYIIQSSIFDRKSKYFFSFPYDIPEKMYRTH